MVFESSRPQAEQAVARATPLQKGEKMKNISFDGVGQVIATFQVEDGAVDGGVVTMTGDGTVGLGKASDLPCGVLLDRSEDGVGAVQVEGMATVSFTGEAPTVGYGALVCDGQGGVAKNDSGRLCLIVSVDEDGQTAVIKL
jgi:hypothetical protein